MIKNTLLMAVALGFVTTVNVATAAEEEEAPAATKEPTPEEEKVPAATKEPTPKEPTSKERLNRKIAAAATKGLNTAKISEETSGESSEAPLVSDGSSEASPVSDGIVVE
jgi:hypothetical protein